MMYYKLAVVDDDLMNLRGIEQILISNGYDVTCLSSGEELLDHVETNRIDLILLDVHMIGIDGFETLKELRMTRYGHDVPVIFLTADDDTETETRALEAGALDFVTKPVIPNVLLLRVRNTIELLKLRRHLETEVKRKTEEVISEHEKNKRLSLQLLQTIAGAIDAKDNYTRGHSSRVAKYAMEIARRSGAKPKELEEIYMMGLLHDVGKIGIPDAVINKPSRLTDEEYALIKTHSMVGFDILKNITEMPKLAVGARWHHERYDGTGYPDGLVGTDIPAEARMIAVADAYDAMSSNRSYHNVYAQQYIRRELEEGKGTQFDPKFADIMLQMIDEDKEYFLREHDIQTPEKGVGGSKVTGEVIGEKKFGFLELLETVGIDTAVGMKYCLNDVEFYLEMLNEFSYGAGDRRDNLRRCCDEGDWERYRIYVHSLKSAARTIGAVGLSGKAEAMENAVKSGDTANISAENEELIGALGSTIASILMATSTYNN